MFLRLGGCQYTEKQAKATITGFAFGETELKWKRRRDSAGGDPFHTSRGRWAYRTYDCVPASTGPICEHDATLTAAVDSRIGGEAVLGIMAIADEVSEALAYIPISTTFWQLPRKELEGVPSTKTQAWWMWRAWGLMAGVPQVGRTVCNKVLHHKRPWLFPLVDSVTEKPYGKVHVWAKIHDDLSTQAAQFVELESWFAALAVQQRGAPLTRLRIHDILLWCDLTRSRAEAERLGKAVIKTNGRHTQSPVNRSTP